MVPTTKIREQSRGSSTKLGKQNTEPVEKSGIKLDKKAKEQRKNSKQKRVITIMRGYLDDSNRIYPIECPKMAHSHKNV